MVITNEKTLGELVAEIPGAARILEKYRIDYCCGGKHALAAACRERGITQEVLLSELEQAATQQPQTGEREWNTAPLRELIDHILSRHHAYLKSELPRIAELFAKVVRAHGDREPVLFQVRETFTALREELDTHMMREELILFPAIAELEVAGGEMMPFCCIEHPIARMEHEHESAGRALVQMRQFTRDYTIPVEACNAYRALFAALIELETDLHQHIQLENNVLFLRAMKLKTQ